MQYLVSEKVKVSERFRSLLETSKCETFILNSTTLQNVTIKLSFLERDKHGEHVGITCTSVVVVWAYRPG